MCYSSLFTNYLQTCLEICFVLIDLLLSRIDTVHPFTHNSFFSLFLTLGTHPFGLDLIPTHLNHGSERNQAIQSPSKPSYSTSSD